jgi:hypothetical protein
MIAHQSVADILRDHVRLAVEGIDRMYLNVYVPQLQMEQGVVRFFKYHRGQPLPSAALMARSAVASWRSWSASLGSRTFPSCSFARASARTR